MGILTHLNGFTDQKRLNKTKKKLKVGAAGGWVYQQGLGQEEAEGGGWLTQWMLRCTGLVFERGFRGDGLTIFRIPLTLWLPKSSYGLNYKPCNPSPPPQTRFWTEIYDGAKLFYLSGIQHGKYLKREVFNLARFISVMKMRPLTWRLAHPYALVDRFEVGVEWRGGCRCGMEGEGESRQAVA